MLQTRKHPKKLVRNFSGTFDHFMMFTKKKKKKKEEEKIAHIFSVYVHTDAVTYFSQDNAPIVLIFFQGKYSVNLINIR